VEPKPNPFSRIVGVIVSPEATFQSIARRPDWVVPLVLWMLLSLISGALIVRKVDFAAAAREQIEQQKNVPPEQVDRMVRMGVAVGKVIAYCAPIWTALIFVIVAGVLLITFRLFGGEGTFKQAFSVTLYGWVPKILQGIILLVILCIKPAVSAEGMRTLIRSNPGFLVDMKTNPMAFALLSSLDIFTIWTLVLLIIGFAIFTRASKAKSAAIIISWWIVIVLFKLIPAAIQAAKAKG
jgi:hypothetical protein